MQSPAFRNEDTHLYPGPGNDIGYYRAESPGWSGLEHLVCEERLRDWSLVQTGEEMACGRI